MTPRPYDAELEHAKAVFAQVEAELAAEDAQEEAA